MNAVERFRKWAIKKLGGCLPEEPGQRNTFREKDLNIVPIFAEVREPIDYRRECPQTDEEHEKWVEAEMYRRIFDQIIDKKLVEIISQTDIRTLEKVHVGNLVVLK